MLVSGGQGREEGHRQSRELHCGSLVVDSKVDVLDSPQNLPFYNIPKQSMLLPTMYDLFRSWNRVCSVVKSQYGQL
jgi:hypothetical protein